MNDNATDMQTLYFDRLPIELYQLLKLEGLVNSGGEAKQLISEGQVGLNGSVETRKRKKIFNGDVITFNGARFLVKDSDK